MNNPYDKAREQKRITELLKENAELKAENKRLASEAWTQGTKAEVLDSLLHIRADEVESLTAKILYYQSKIETVINTLRDENSN